MGRDSASRASAPEKGEGRFSLLLCAHTTLYQQQSTTSKIGLGAHHPGHYGFLPYAAAAAAAAAHAASSSSSSSSSSEASSGQQPPPPAHMGIPPYNLDPKSNPLDSSTFSASRAASHAKRSDSSIEVLISRPDSRVAQRRETVRNARRLRSGRRGRVTRNHAEAQLILEAWHSAVSHGANFFIRAVQLSTTLGGCDVLISLVTTLIKGATLDWPCYAGKAWASGSPARPKRVAVRTSSCSAPSSSWTVDLLMFCTVSMRREDNWSGAVVTVPRLLEYRAPSRGVEITCITNSSGHVHSKKGMLGYQRNMIIQFRKFCEESTSKAKRTSSWHQEPYCTCSRPLAHLDLARKVTPAKHSLLRKEPYRSRGSWQSAARKRIVDEARVEERGSASAGSTKKYRRPKITQGQ
ncbi:unnamed protein product [Notodromas monacha]|uniref:Uncharacterized protein n=1 Tax=Notodromas monacha TaxID=399045 RepID=A0A7R9GG48_9CRUS|nr:unnamed protein product [Notodromas monacha]CAG0919822.1 unnamed protein product [Notodromas monacha]